MIVGLTGGIGSGKSTVARMLVEDGFVVIDADQVAREVVEPGRPALDRIAEHFGTEVIAPDGALDRAALAAIVFNDDRARRALEAITHPAIGAEIVRRADATRELDPAAIVVIDHPLLIETDQVEDFDGLIVVVATRETRLDRLQEHRGIDRDDALARMQSQVDDDARRAAATWVIDNDDDLAALKSQVVEVAAAIRQQAGES